MRTAALLCALITTLPVLGQGDDAPSTAAEAIDRLHIVIPAGPGGGLDGTARESGRALQVNGLANSVSYENISGGGGGRAMGQFIETAARRQGADAPLLINSAPLIVRSLQGLFPYSFRDLKPVSALVADYGIFVVRASDGPGSWHEVVDRLKEDPRAIIVGGGSVRGSLDHIVLALALDAVGIDARRVRYLPYDGGGKAMLALLGGEVGLLSTGAGETTAMIESGEVRVLASTAPQRIAALGAAPTLTELGIDVVFANWRGVFGPKKMLDAERDAHVARYAAMRETDTWREALQRRGWDNLALDGEAFGAFLEDQEEQFGAVMRKLGFIQ